MNTTVTITKELKQKLDDLGKKSESYNDIITKLYNSHMSHQHMLLREHANNIAQTYSGKNDQFSKRNAKILKDVASGKTISFAELKRRLEDKNVLS